ncbi:unnamed protein product [Penicillium salamii]|uniref:Uncharacterized protein n=1 Tax=Penicillium salamii TaxID=1612424 RepID=A0A9W4J071_9EURO|nr:unnamed protein product [Penicillium salamii]CAG8363337.1 unnamed protein product [Penicillium salamii]CAG8365440.1 unnamed protein product [Penicillium salamii]CAG8385288.1 unnamed protein product [Penicillium salamii]
MSSSPTEEAGPSNSAADFTKRLQKYRPQIQVLNVETEHQRAAFSQRRNLLFTAQGSDIYVWIPRGSNQLLGAQPEMIIHPVMNQPHAPGYIDPARPHTINNIIVDDLGRDEVLLIATDSGNVTGYNVEVIFSAIGRCDQFMHEKPFAGDDVKAFFVEFVGRSAWGLATHKFARLIAVSANTGVITVFAFALVEESSTLFSPYDPYETAQDHQQSGELGQTWLIIDDEDQLDELSRKLPHHRARNLRLNYTGHFENIPCVSFANFDLDPNGTWMISTDIFNRVLIWKIWEALGPVKGSAYGSPSQTPPQRGWFVLPIDPRRVQKHYLKTDACGCMPKEKLFHNQIAFITSDMIHHISDWSTVLSPSYREPLPTRHYLPDDVFYPDCIDGSSSAMGLSGPGSESSSDGEMPSTDSDHKLNAHMAPSPENDHESDCEIFPKSETPGPPSLRARRGIPDLIEDANEHQHRCASGSFEVEELRKERPLELQQNYPFHPHNPEFFPVVHFSEHDISLISYPCDSNLQIIARSPLTQTPPRNMRIHDFCDRMNMVKYVPELGLILAASQKGRVAVITLTWQAEIGHSFRIDWIVPFNSQGMDLSHPRVPLMGMAVSPMPGYEQLPDIPCIPCDVNPKEWLEFDYRLLNPDQDESSDIPSEPDSFRGFNSNTSSPKREESESGDISTSDDSSPHSYSNAASHEKYEASDMSTSDKGSQQNSNPNTDIPEPSAGQNDSDSPEFHPSNRQSEVDDDPILTLPELHAHASDIYQPRENWHGWHPSRHYRLMLLFCNHSVMSYEFWHTWKN